MTAEKARRRPVGRPRADGRDPIQKADIIRTASQLFAKNGYAGTSVRMIADALKIHPASVFHHYPAKEMIVQEIIDAMITESFEIYDEVLSLNLDPAATLYDTIWTDAYVTRTNASELASVFFLPEIRSGAITTERNVEVMIIDHYCKLIETGIKSGDFVEVDTRTIGDAIYATCSSMAAHEPETLAPIEIQATNIANLFVRGLLTNPKALTKIQKEASKFKISAVRAKLLA